MTPEQAERMLQSALRYIGARYGGTEAHHIITLALRKVQKGQTNGENNHD